MVLSFGDLFSGMSCPAFALKQNNIDFEYKFACDIDKKCRKFLVENHNPEIVYANVMDVLELPYVDVMVMGFPCQPFSTVNTSVKTDDHKSKDMYEQCIRCINLSRPKTFIMENVRGLTFKTKKPYFDKVIAGLDSLEDYTYEYKVLNSKDYGIPQNRQRIWFIGKLKPPVEPDPVQWPDPCELQYKLPDFIDLDEPMPSFKSNAKNGNPIDIDGDGMYMSNGQPTGQFTVYKKYPTDISFCIHTQNYRFLFKKDGDNVTARGHTLNEVKKLFGCTTELKGEWSNGEYKHFFGNGMDINMVGKLMISNITQ